MEKIRVYELAKELNTTSKRLIEKLAEININVKNHMSLLNQDELEALYKHIGIIKHDSTGKPEAEEKKAPAPAQTPKVEVKKDARRVDKNAPRIIRTTEIIVDSKDDSGSSQRRSRGTSGGSNKKSHKWDVRSAASTSGLRPGLVYNDDPFYMVDLKSMSKPEAKGDQAAKTADTQITKTADIESKMPQVSRDMESKTSQAADQGVSDTKIVAAAEKKTTEKPVETAKEKTTEKPEQTPVQKTAEKKGETAAKKDENKVETQELKVPPKNEADQEDHKAEKAGSKESRGESAEAGKTQPKETEQQDKKPKETGQKDKKAQEAAVDAGAKSDHRSGDKTAGRDAKEHHAEKTGLTSHHQHEDRQAHELKTRQDNKAASADRTHRGEGRPSADHGQQEEFAGRQKRGGGRAQADNRASARHFDMSKVEFTEVKREELNNQRTESRRDFNSRDRDLDKAEKREQRRENLKGAATKNKRFKSQNITLRHKADITEMLSDEFVLDELYDDDLKVRKASKSKKAGKNNEKKSEPPKPVMTSITIPETISVKDLAEVLKKTAAEVIKKFMEAGMMVTLNQEVDFDAAAIIAEEFGVKAEKEVTVKEEDILFDESEDREEDLVPRPPVVVVMGHVDHGKTSLLDAIRKTNVTANEAGGITQHIGAYMVKLNDRNITFLDTPGHEAFTAMRARGARVTDIAVLVVAADDGVMPQTVEAINHAKAAGVSIIVAINKVDKPDSNPERVKQQLTEYGLVPEEWGGDTIMVPVSARTGQNIDYLLEMILLVADMLELKANPNKQAKGTVIEARLDKDKGAVATLLVQRGTLKVGDSIITGATFGRIRAMRDDKGNRITNAGPSTPVEIIGLPEVPEAGQVFYVVTDEKLAKQLVEKRKASQREEHLKATSRVSLEDLFSQIQAGHVKELNIIIKADVQGSVEAVKQALEKLSNDEVKVKIIHGGVGAITESDVNLADVSNAIIIGFNVRPGANVSEIAKDAGVDIRLYRVIYNAIEDIQAAMKGMLEPTFREVILGHVEIRKIFKVSGVGTVGGCYVVDGKITRNADIRVVRDGIVIHEGKLASLKRFKDDVREVEQGYECGLSIEKFNDIKEGDIVEAYTMEKVER